MAAADFYELLGLVRSATAEEIKSAYRGRAKAYHPDGNGGGGDPERFSRLAEAYETLNDPERRAQYDASFYDPPQDAAQSKPLDPILCSACGRVTAQPRYAVFWTVVSAVIVTWRTPTQGIYCSSCARKISLRCSAISAVAGWWGMWGILWTPIMILRNASGGDQPAGTATKMLWYNALAFWSNGKLATAYALAKMVARSPGDLADDAAKMLTELQRGGVPADTPAFADAWRKHLGDFAPHLAMLAAVPAIIVAMAITNAGGSSSTAPSYAGTISASPLAAPAPAVQPPSITADAAPIPGNWGHARLRHCNRPPHSWTACASPIVFRPNVNAPQRARAERPLNCGSRCSKSDQ